MYTMMLCSMMLLMMIIMLTMLMNLMSKKKIMDREKNSPFECGFDPKSSSRIPFSLHFFLIAMIFLIFDIEISLLFPMSISIKNSNMLTFSIMMISINMILIMGLIHEWIQGSLKWKS